MQNVGDRRKTPQDIQKPTSKHSQSYLYLREGGGLLSFTGTV